MLRRVAGCHGVHVSRVSFPGERYVWYTVLRKKEMNNKRKEDKSEKTLTKKDEQLKNYKQ